MEVITSVALSVAEAPGHSSVGPVGRQAAL